MSPTLFLFALTFSPCLLVLRHLPDEDKNVRESLTQCVVGAAKRFFDEDKTIVYSLPLADDRSSQPSAIVFDRLMLHELTRDCSWSVLVKNVSLELTGIDQKMQKPSHYIIQMRYNDEFSKNVDILRNYSNWNPHAKFLIISPRIVDKPRQTATSVMKKLWKVHVVNGVVLLPNQKNKTVFNAYTWFPYKDGNCGDDFDRVRKIDSCSFGKFDDFVHWYPNKIPDKFNACTIKVRMVDWPPFVIHVPNGTWSNSASSLSGMEINLLNIVAEALDLRMFYYYSQFALNWGNVYENGSITGNLKYLHDEIDDVAIGSYAKTMERSYFFEDIFYLYDSLVFCVPYSVTNTKLETLFEIIGLGAFLLTFIVYTTVTTLMWLTSTEDSSSYQNLKSCTMNTFSALLSFPAASLPKTSKVRFFLAMLLLYSFCIMTAYQTLLASALASASNKQDINRIEDIINGKMDIYAIETTSRYFSTDGSNPSTNKINAAILKKWKNCVNTRECLDQVAFSKNASVVFTKLFTEYIVNSYRTQKNDPLIYCLDKPVVSLPLTILMRKGFQLYDRFNLLIQRIVNAGFIQKWERDILSTRYENITSSDEEFSSAGNDLDFDSLKPVFAIWGVGSGLATAVFITEIFFYRWINKRK